MQILELRYEHTLRNFREMYVKNVVDQNGAQSCLPGFRNEVIYTMFQKEAWWTSQHLAAVSLA